MTRNPFNQPRLLQFLPEDIRMRIHHIIATTAMALGLAMPVWAQLQTASDSMRPSTATAYDFAYRATDNRVNVFDDGVVTRIQLPEGTLLPTLVALQPKGEVLLHPKREGTYLVVEGLHQQLRLRWANAKDIAVSYTGQAALTQRLGQAAAFGAIQPSAQFGMASKPVANANLTSVQATPTTEKVPSLSTAAAATAASVSASAAAVTPVPQPTGPARSKFALLPSDKTVDVAFSRWAREAGLKKRVMWRVSTGKLPLDAVAEIEATSVVEAMTEVAKAFDSSAFPFAIEEYDNAIVVVSKISARLNK